LRANNWQSWTVSSRQLNESYARDYCDKIFGWKWAPNRRERTGISMNFLVQDALWAVERLKKKLEKHLLLPRMSIPTTTPDLYDKVWVDRNLAIPMRDGVLLYADIYRPEVGKKLPVILTRMPYGKTEYYCYLPAIGRYWARKGYAYVAQDVRGKWRSGGKWDPFVNEAKDGYDTLDWIARQPWCSGNIGMTGESYYGYTAWAAATTGHPDLKCISPSTTAMDIYGVWIYNSGALCLQTMGTWAFEMNAQEYRNSLRLDYEHLPLVSMDDRAGFTCDYYKDWLKHQRRDSYWDPINLYEKYTKIAIPVLHFGGWYDAFLKATIDDWLGVTKNSDDLSARKNQWLVIGPWDHEYTTDIHKRIGQLDIGDASVMTYMAQCQAFFDFWLKGISNGFDQTSRVQYFVIGDNEWRSMDEWPPKGTSYQDLYFHSGGNAHQADGDGLLSPLPPALEQPADGYAYDPRDPVALTVNVDLWSRAEHLQDRALLPQRSDVLVYDTEPLGKDLEVTGPIQVILYASSSAVDTDFTAALVDLFPNGRGNKPPYAHLIQEGILRASYRISDQDQSPIEPGHVYEYTIDLWSTSYVVKAGHRIRVEISSSNFNRYDRNPNTGEPLAIATNPIIASQQIFHTPDYPSHITLPTSQELTRAPGRPENPKGGISRNVR
jgi:putative CocE/NonD family hydrolase